jgi:LPS export ABC transporter protein LptC
MRIISAVLGAFLSFGVACREAAQLPVTVSAQADSADQTIYGMKTLITDRGLLRADVAGDTAFVFDEGTRFLLKNVRSIFYTPNGAKNATLTSKRGIYNTRQNSMEALGDVVVISEDGRRLTTPQLRFSQTRNEISSDSAFVLTEPGRRLEGVGFISDPGMNTVRVLRAASGAAGQVLVPGAKGPQPARTINGRLPGQRP